MDDKLTLKKKVLAAATSAQAEKVKMLKQAMKEAQESANDSTSGIEDRFESFKEQCQIDRDMYARRWMEASELLHGLCKLSLDKPSHKVETGAMVITDKIKFLVGVSIGEVKLDDSSYFVISQESPIYKLIEGKKKGDSYSWAGQEMKIKDVF